MPQRVCRERSQMWKETETAASCVHFFPPSLSFYLPKICKQLKKIWDMGKSEREGESKDEKVR